jgi:hypothetical protein
MQASGASDARLSAARAGAKAVVAFLVVFSGLWPGVITADDSGDHLRMALAIDRMKAELLQIRAAQCAALRSNVADR